MGVTPTQLQVWDPVDRELLLTHLENEASRCPGCGGYLDDTTDEGRAQEVHDDTLCHRCAALAAHQKHLENTKQQQPGALIWARTVDIPPDS